MKKINEVIIVEGRYDKNTVAQVVNATIIETAGFGVFKDEEKLSLLKRLAEKRGIIILTDSDKAGFFIRGRLRGMLNEGTVKHAYIPDVKGRERRKKVNSAEGKLGVEAMTGDVIIKALERAGATFSGEDESAVISGPVTSMDLYNAGLSGQEESAAKRRKILKELGLPERLSTKGMLDVLNVLFSREEFLLFLNADI